MGATVVIEDVKLADLRGCGALAESLQGAGCQRAPLSDETERRTPSHAPIVSDWKASMMLRALALALALAAVWCSCSTLRHRLGGECFQLVGREGRA